MSLIIFYSWLSVAGWIAAATAWLSAVNACFDGDAPRVFWSGNAGMLAVWFAMRMSDHANQIGRELRMHHTRETIGSLVPKSR